MRFWAAGIIDGKDAVGSSAGCGLVLDDLYTQVVDLVDIPVGISEEMLELLIVDVGFSGYSRQVEAFVIIEHAVNETAQGRELGF